MAEKSRSWIYDGPASISNNEVEIKNWQQIGEVTEIQPMEMRQVKTETNGVSKRWCDDTDNDGDHVGDRTMEVKKVRRIL